MTAASGLTRADVALAATRALADYRLRPPGFTPQPHQVPPPGNWYGWLMNAGRGSGKTRASSNYVIEHVKGPPCLPGPTPHWIGIIAPTLGDAVTACVSGPSGIATHDQTAKLSGGAGGLFVKWSNGSRAKLFGASSQEDVERLRAGGNTCWDYLTPVETERGQVPIYAVKVGDRVWTRAGLRRVLAVHNNGRCEVWRVTLSDGRTLDGTPNHEVFANGVWTRIDELRVGSTITSWSQITSPMTASAGTNARMAITQIRDAGYFTGTSSSSITEQSLPVSTFTTKTTTSQTTTSVISWLFTQVNIFDFTQGVTWLSVIDEQGKPQPKLFARVVSNLSENYAQMNADTVAARLTTHMATRATATSTITGRSDSNSEFAQSAEVNSAHLKLAPRPNAEKDVVVDLSGNRGSALNSPSEHASSAEYNSRETSEASLELVHVSVLAVKPLRYARPVFDLTVEEHPEYFANGILSHNCLVWAEELAAWRYLQECYEQMRFGLRTGPTPRWIASTTPKPKPLIKKLVKQTPHNVVVTHATTNDNPHLEQFIRDALFEEYADRDIGRQELYAAIMEQDESALWRRDDLEQFRVVEAPPLAKISVGVDPSGGAGEQGIVVAGKHAFEVVTAKGRQRKFEGYVLDDRTCHLGPAGWGRRAVQAAIDWDADDIVVETNFGGQMAVVTIRDAAEALGVSIPVKEIHASRGKRVRAEPVAALSSRGQWHHVGLFEQLEDQLCTWHEDLGYSPDRLDAMVWTPWHQRIVSTRPRGLGSMPTGGSMTRAIG